MFQRASLDTLGESAPSMPSKDFWLQPVKVNKPNVPLTWEGCYIAFRKCGFGDLRALGLMQRCQKVSSSLPNIDQLVAFSSNYLFSNRTRLDSTLEPLVMNVIRAQMALDNILEPSSLTVICYWRRHVTGIFQRYYRCLAETFAVLGDFCTPDWLSRDALHYPYPSMEQFYSSVRGNVFWSVRDKSYRVRMHTSQEAELEKAQNLFWFPPWHATYKWSCPDLPNIAPQDDLNSLGELISKAIGATLLGGHNLCFESTDETLLSYVRPVALDCISHLLTIKYKAVCAHPNECDRRFEVFFKSKEEADAFSQTHPDVDSQVYVEPILTDLSGSHVLTVGGST